MGILHRHIFASVALACLAAVTLFAFVLITGTALRDLLGYVVAGQLEAGTAARLVVLLLPYVAVFALPIGLLTAVLLVLGRMSSQHEITAMRAAGLSFGYLARPIWIIALAAVGLSLGLNYYLMPMARTAYRTTLLQAVRQNPLNFIVAKTFIRDFKDVVIYVGERRGAEILDVWVWKLDEQKRVTGIVHAASGQITFREADSVLIAELKEALGEVRDAHDPEDFSRPQLTPNSGLLPLEFSLSGMFRDMRITPKPAWMTLDELTARRAVLAAKGDARTASEKTEFGRIKIALQEKAASSFAVLAFALVAVPLGIKVSRKETSANLGIAVVLVLGYYFLSSLVGLMNRLPQLHPEYWMWLPPLTYAVAGFVLFRRLGRA
jgi:lipopolysaccharide export system permease protein